MSGGEKVLNERKKAILKAIVDAHIAGGEPVGSKFLTQNQQIGCSSATIRNEMAELEEMGYLEQPHTSAGRIPSEAGYRFYVDQLLDRYNLTQSEIEELRGALRQKQNELDAIMQTAVTLASKLTNYTALSLRPRQSRITVGCFELMRLDDATAVLIMLIGSVVKTKYIRSSRAAIPPEAASLLAGVLNAKITGLTAGEITMPLIMEMERMMGEYDYLVSPVVRAVCETISGFDGGDLRFEGINRLLAYPEFYDMDRLREMLALFEKKDTLLEVLSDEAHQGDHVQIFIGRENLVKVMDNSTLVFKTVMQNGKPVGAIGIIGPTRMNYRRVIATIDGLSKGIAETIEAPKHGGSDGA
ncbi:MAG: heat-inducible transcription repressor HrcA [Clostridia bacterium]|nr:heat-inducible transcription repressor HrcA [Clostridia bacterium]